MAFVPYARDGRLKRVDPIMTFCVQIPMMDIEGLNHTAENDMTFPNALNLHRSCLDGNRRPANGLANEPVPRRMHEETSDCASWAQNA